MISQRRRQIGERVLKNLFTTVTIEIRDSEARDQLANERTFLSWIRTGFAIAAVGIVVSRLPVTGTPTLVVERSAKILSLFYIVLGLLAIIMGSLRFMHVQYLLTDNKYPLSGMTIMIVTVCGTAIFIATIVLFMHA